jgi:hypothetical protein
MLPLHPALAYTSHVPHVHMAGNCRHTLIHSFYCDLCEAHLIIIIIIIIIMSAVHRGRV